MENIKSIFTDQINQSLPVKKTDQSNIKDIEEEKKVQVAKGFESILINNLLDEMKNTVGSWGGEKDSASSQINGIFWLNLSKEISDQGGFGLWKDIYKSMPGNEQAQETENSIGKE